MPGFVRTKKDEARWAKAKEAAKRSKKKEESEFTDIDWALVNHIYHRMSKSDVSRIEALQQVLSKARARISAVLEKAGRKLSDEDYEMDEDLPEEEPSQLDYEFDPSEEQSEELDIEEPKQERVAGKAHLQDLTPQDLEQIRRYSVPQQRWHDMLDAHHADAHENPEKHRHGHSNAVLGQAYETREQAIENFRNSPEYKSAGMLAKQKMMAGFIKDWTSNNPDHAHHVASKHADIVNVGEQGKKIHAAEKHEQTQHVLRGGAQADVPMSMEAAMQHVGGTKSEEGATTGTVIQDPAAAFARQHGQKFLSEYGKQYKPKMGVEGIDLEEEKQKAEKLKAERPLPPRPKELDHVGNKRVYDSYFSRYYPLINISAKRVSSSYPDMVRSRVQDDLTDVGHKVLNRAFNTYDPHHEKEAKFSTYARRQLEDAMRGVFQKEYDKVVPRHLQQAAKQAAIAGPSSEAVSAAPSMSAPAPSMPAPVPSEAPKAPSSGIHPDIAKHPAMTPDRHKNLQQIHSARAVIRRRGSE